MAVKPLYLNFFEFLGQMGKEDPWLAYQRLYIQPHLNFFEAYWKTFNHFDSPQIAARVRKIKEEDYGQLRSLVQSQDPAVLAEAALNRCRGTLPLNPEPLVYLFVGFFSADGTTLEVEGWPSIALGLERFKDFKDLPLLVSHEYCHCAQRSLLRNFFPPQERPLLFFIVAEGLSVLFSEVVYPEIPLHRHLFLTPERLQWCQEKPGGTAGVGRSRFGFGKTRSDLFRTWRCQCRPTTAHRVFCGPADAGTLPNPPRSGRFWPRISWFRRIIS